MKEAVGESASAMDAAAKLVEYLEERAGVTLSGEQRNVAIQAIEDLGVDAALSDFVTAISVVDGMEVFAEAVEKTMLSL